MQIPNPVHATPEKYVIGCCNYDGASAPRFRHALRQALTPMSQSARTHTSHTGCVCTQITWTWLCTRGKKRYKYCLFSHTNRSFRVLGHQCVVTVGLQIYKMINLGSNVIVYKLKHCVLHFEVNMMTF